MPVQILGSEFVLNRAVDPKRKTLPPPPHGPEPLLQTDRQTDRGRTCWESGSRYIKSSSRLSATLAHSDTSARTVTSLLQELVFVCFASDQDPTISRLVGAVTCSDFVSDIGSTSTSVLSGTLEFSAS